MLNVQELAAELAAARAKYEFVTTPLSSRDGDFNLDAAYAVEAELAKMRQAEGHSPVGRKIGFASKAMWRKLGIKTVVWGTVYDDTLHYAADNRATYSLAGRFAPRLEPEIVFKLKSPLTSGANDVAAVLAAVEWLALGYEVVECMFPNWEYKTPDFVAAYGFHAGLIVGTPLPVTPENSAELAEQLATFKMRLLKNGEQVGDGGGKNVLGNPALSLGELAEALTRQAGAITLAAGEVITTGTLTPAPPVSPGEEWVTELDGIPLPALTVKFS